MVYEVTGFVTIYNSLRSNSINPVQLIAPWDDSLLKHEYTHQPWMI